MDADTSSRRWAALLFVGFLMMLMVLGRLASADGSPTPTAMIPVLTPVPTQPMIAARQRLAWLTECQQPDRIGAYRPTDAPCQPSTTWPLAAFTAQLVQLNVLADGEQLTAFASHADVECPLVVVTTNTLFQGRVCFSPEGNVYRELLDQTITPWSWAFTAEGQWSLVQPVAASGQ